MAKQSWVLILTRRVAKRGTQVGEEVYPDPQKAYFIHKATEQVPPSKHRLLFSLTCRTCHTQRRVRVKSARLQSGLCWKERMPQGTKILQGYKGERNICMSWSTRTSYQPLYQKSSLNLSGAMRLKSVLPSPCHKTNISSPSEPPGATTSPGNRKNSGTAPETMPSQKVTALCKKSSAKLRDVVWPAASLIRVSNEALSNGASVCKTNSCRVYMLAMKSLQFPCRGRIIGTACSSPHGMVAKR